MEIAACCAGIYSQGAGAASRASAAVAAEIMKLRHYFSCSAEAEGNRKL